MLLGAQVRRRIALHHGQAGADCVLVDAPCSGLGVLSKRADLRWNRSEKVGIKCRGELIVDWAGLGWTGLGWTGLDWTGLDWTGLDWTLYFSLP